MSNQEINPIEKAMMDVDKGIFDIMSEIHSLLEGGQCSESETIFYLNLLSKLEYVGRSNDNGQIALYEKMSWNSGINNIIDRKAERQKGLNSDYEKFGTNNRNQIETEAERIVR